MSVRVTRGSPVSPSPPSQASRRHSLSKIRPLASLLGWRKVESSPSVDSRMMRLFPRSVKYRVPSSATVGPSVKATVVATVTSAPAAPPPAGAASARPLASSAPTLSSSAVSRSITASCWLSSDSSTRSTWAVPVTRG